MMEGTAHDRLQRSLRSEACTPGQQLDLKPGDLVDFYRTPYTKDHSGWLGPAKVVNTTEIDKDNIVVKWQSRVFSVSIRHVRRALVYYCWVQHDSRRQLSENASMRAIQNRIHGIPPGKQFLLAAMWSQQGWQLTREAKLHHTLFLAIMRSAHVHLGLFNCSGARFGTGCEPLHALKGVSGSMLFFWPRIKP